MATSVTFDGVTYSIPGAGEVNWPSLSSLLIAFGDKAAVAKQMKQAVRVATTTPVTVSATTDCVVVTDLATPGAVAVNLPAGVDGQWFVVLDGKGDALTNNVTITPNGSETVNGGATYVLAKDNQGVVLVYSSATSNWNVVASYVPTTGSIVDADVASSAAIAYSKLNLTGGIVNADVASSAAIAHSKLADASALSVLGRSGNTDGALAAIAAGTDHHVLRRSGTTLGFGLISNSNVDASAAIDGSKIQPSFTSDITTSASAPKVIAESTNTSLGSNDIIATWRTTSADTSNTSGIASELLIRSGSSSGASTYADWQFSDTGTLRSFFRVGISTNGWYSHVNSDASYGWAFSKSSNGTSANVFINFFRGGGGITSLGTDAGDIRLSSGTLALAGPSDERLKQNIRTYDRGLSDVLALRAVEFDWKDGHSTDVKGFVAQEVQSVLPKSVGTRTSDDMLVLTKDEMIPVLWSAVRELAAKVAALEGAT